MNTNKLLVSLTSLLVACSVTKAVTVGTAFTYQGKLNTGSSGSTGLYDFQFLAYDAPTTGILKGVFVTNAVPVTNGSFTVKVNFTNANNIFDGNSRFLEIGVRSHAPASPFAEPLLAPGSFTTLSPRQELTATPYAAYALTAGEATIAATATTALAVAPGAVPASLLVVSNETTSATPRELFLPGSGERLAIPRGSAWSFDLLVVGRSQESGEFNLASKAAYQIRGVIDSDGSGVHVAGKAVTVIYESATAYNADVDSDPTSSALIVRVTGLASTRVHWVASVRLAQVAFP